MYGITDDLRCAFRNLRRRPALTLAALVTLALGIGANSAIFTVIEGVLIHPLPYPGADRLVFMEVSYRHGEYRINTEPSFALIDAWRKAPSLARVEAYEHVNVRLGGRGEETAAEIDSLLAAPGIFDCLGVEPLLGRAFSGDDGSASAEPVVMLGHRLWRSRFGADPAVLGATVEIDDVPHTVVGVLPPHARFVDPLQEVDLWRPLDPRPADPENTHAAALGRLRPGATVAAGRAEVEALSAPFDAAVDADLEPVLQTPRDLFSDFERVLLLFQAAIGCVLLIACVNVAQLLLAQGEARSRELAMRATLGASGGRLLRQLLTESGVLALLGGAGGLLAASWGLAYLLRLLPEDLRHLERLSLNPAVLAFTLVLSLSTGVAFGLLGAFQGLRPDLAASLREGAAQAGVSRRRGRLRQGLVGAQVTLALVLLAGAGWLIRSLVGLARLDPGFETEGLLVARLDLDPGRTLSDEQRSALAGTILEGLRGAGPAFREVTLADRMPPGASRVHAGAIEAEGRPPADAQTMSPEVAVVPGYFRVMGIPLREGTEPEAAAGAAERSVVVNESLAKALWNEESAVGRRFRFLPEGPWLSVAGVVGRVRQLGLTFDEDLPVVFSSYSAWPHRSPELAIRSAVEPSRLVPELEARLSALAPGVRIRRIATAEERLAATIELERFNAFVMSVFAAIAAVLTAVGIYGVVAYAVSLRTREIGVRMALGARTASVLGLVMRRSLAPVAAGGVLGLAGALGSARILEHYLKNVRAGDPGVLAAVVLLVALVALLATWLPARRAARVDPSASLRWD
jgi:predicted permease